MRQSIEYLQDAIEKLGVENDVQAAAALRISKQALSHYRTGTRIMDDFACIMVAKVLGIDGMEIIAATQMEREKDQERREIWADFRKKFGVKMGIAGLAVTMTIGSLTPTKASAENLANSQHVEAKFAMPSILCKIDNPTDCKLCIFQRQGMHMNNDGASA
ncbi:hypothetical protein [Chromobacterium sp. ASV23]|uniref:hypothetical protein n=1 Tax=Chromobacterium sp. ASV23 TaxID=2795110 RepID=UPI0018EAAF21|nr:hypothetical protein [Chromobacterium sp. ASV23]